MTVNEIKTALGIRLDDPNEERYTSSVKYSALTNALEVVVGTAYHMYLTGYQETSTFTASALGNSLPGNYSRYILSSLYLKSPIQYIQNIPIDKLGELDNRYLVGSNVDPKCYVWNDTYFLLVDTYNGNYNKVKLDYIKKVPLLDSTVIDLGVDQRLHNIVLDLAESSLRMTYGHGDLSTIHTMGINALNALEKFSGIITSGVQDG